MVRTQKVSARSAGVFRAGRAAFFGGFVTHCRSQNWLSLLELAFIIMYFIRDRNHNNGRYMRTSRKSLALPIPARHALRKLGHDIRNAHRRRLIPAAISPERA